MKCIKVSKDPNKNWENDAFQFPRLIAEAEQAGVFTDEVIDTLCCSMDWTADELTSLLDRAQAQWDAIKQATP